VQAIVGRLDTHLAATQLGITMANLGLGWIGEVRQTQLAELAAQGNATSQGGSSRPDEGRSPQQLNVTEWQQCAGKSLMSESVWPRIHPVFVDRHRVPGV
jgi:hypothetical protein